MTRGTWTRRIGMTAVATAAVAVMAVPAGAQAATANASTSTTATTTATAAAVDYDTWQQDCQAVMDQALPYLQQRIADAKSGEKQAIVFDVDNTTLATDLGFTVPQSANKPVLKVAQYAQEHGVSLFFISGRPKIVSAATKANLELDGYEVSGLYTRNVIQLFQNLADFKTAQRVDIESKGYTIIANIGNSDTDLSGGHAEKTFKLPDYNGQLS